MYFDISAIVTIVADSPVRRAASGTAHPGCGMRLEVTPLVLRARGARGVGPRENQRHDEHGHDGCNPIAGIHNRL